MSPSHYAQRTVTPVPQYDAWYEMLYDVVPTLEKVLFPLSQKF